MSMLLPQLGVAKTRSILDHSPSYSSQTTTSLTTRTKRTVVVVVVVVETWKRGLEETLALQEPLFIAWLPTGLLTWLPTGWLADLVACLVAVFCLVALFVLTETRKKANSVLPVYSDIVMMRDVM
jgi:hypothetical protein